jgi:glycosyltransferase involved in cell wall biosynthesis
VKVSIVTPSFNQAAFIERTLASVAAQSGAEMEHLVFDGGSTDGTQAILERFRPPVTWVSEKDAGQADAVNKGLRAATGEVFGWLNSDDVYYPGAVERVVAFLAAHPEVDVVYGMADHIGRDDEFLESYPTEPWDFERLRRSCFICQPAAFFRRRVIEEHGVLDASLRYCMDYEYWLRLARGGARFAYLQEKLAGSRLHAENKTLGSRVAVHAEINDMMKRHFGRVPRRWMVNYAYACVEANEDSAMPKKLRVAAEYLRARRRWAR